MARIEVRDQCPRACGRRSFPAPLIEPLQQYRELAKPSGSEAIYPGGAVVRIDASHDGSGDEKISVVSLDLKVGPDESQAPCPFKRTGDGLRGGGVGFILAAVRRVRGRRKNRSSAAKGRAQQAAAAWQQREFLLDLGEVLPIVLRKGEDPETMIIRIAQQDDGRYRANLSMRYTNRTGLKTKDLGFVSFCMSGR